MNRETLNTTLAGRLASTLGLCVVLSACAVKDYSAEVTERVAAEATVEALEFDASCTDEYIDPVTEAERKASELVPLAENFPASRFMRWFGFDPTLESNGTLLLYWSDVELKLQDKFAQPTTITYVCGQCKSSSSAAERGGGSVILICPLFLNRPTSGLDNRTGTLIHEGFHLVTDINLEHAKGETAALALAASDPATALQNANNWEYFFENPPPFQPLIE